MILIRRVCIAAMTLTSVWLSACTSPFPNFEASQLLRDSPPKAAQEASWQDAQSHQMPVAVRTAAYRLISLIPESYRENVIMVGAVSDPNQVGTSAALGRVLSEQLQSVMAANGYGVIEMAPKEGPEQVQTPKAPLAVWGTYTAAETVTFVHLKAIRTVDGVIEATSEFTIPNDANVRKLLGRY